VGFCKAGFEVVNGRDGGDGEIVALLLKTLIDLLGPGLRGSIFRRSYFSGRHVVTYLGQVYGRLIPKHAFVSNEMINYSR